MLEAPVFALLAAAGAAGAPSAYAAAAPVPAARDPLKWPFAPRSIWNMPIGSKAVYVPANLSDRPGNNSWAAMPGIDGEHIVMKPGAPPTPLRASDAGWSGRNRCAATGPVLATVPIPGNYIVPHSDRNSAGAFLLNDKRTIVQVQPMARCAAAASGTSMARAPNVDLYGAGIAGARGGSGLSAIGGAIRVGELRPGSATGPRHALKVNVYAKQALYRCTVPKDCFRWPATRADDYAVGWYGAAGANRNRTMKMGALLAIPYAQPIAALGLETAPAKQLAWTLQNYGAYIVDDSWAPGFDISVEDGPDGSVRAQFKADWGFDMMQRLNQDTPWVRDVRKLVRALHVVANNSARTIGGGGVPRQPLAPPIAP